MRLAFSAALALWVSFSAAAAAGGPVDGADGQARPDAGAVPAAFARAVPEAGELIEVTGTRIPLPLGRSPAAVSIFSAQRLREEPAKTLDDRLREAPSFGLFRRSSSLVADPSSQGLNLRGIGPSGVSRSLLLVDGVPANDAFGGWIYWRSLPAAIERVEIAPGGASALYGSAALGGVVQLVLPRIADSIEVELGGGTLGTAGASLRAGRRGKRVAASIEADGLATGGYTFVAPGSRGPVDGRASADHGRLAARMEYEAAPDLLVSLRGSVFGETQNGGTPHTTAAVRQAELVAGARWQDARAGVLDLRLFAHLERFDQDRATILPDPASRLGDALAARQRVPVNDQGLGLLWTRGLGEAHVVSAGLDLRRIQGRSSEQFFPAPPSASTVIRRDAGGEQRIGGLFLQDVVSLGRRLQILAALRGDRWRDLNASRVEQTADTRTRETAFPARSAAQLSPKLALRVQPLEWAAVRASAYRSYRAPTLSELYRPFQTGAVRTESNEALAPERLTGADLGVEVGAAGPGSPRLMVTGFWNRLERPISNVTVGLNRQRRENLGAARVRGLESALALTLSNRWNVDAAYTYLEPVVVDDGGHPEIAGRDLAQDPRHRGSVAVAFRDPDLVTATVVARAQGRQFEDDRNKLPLDRLFVVGASISRRIAAGWEAFAMVSNLFDRQSLVGRQGGIGTVAEPRTFYGGLRLVVSAPDSEPRADRPGAASQR
ncbi:MAG: TonB-dependent receptor [Myxococcales bacterium]